MSSNDNGKPEIASSTHDSPKPSVVLWPIGYHHPEWTKHIKGTLVPYPFWTIMDEVSTFEATEKDIAICTFPKCGTTWMNAIVEMVTHDADPSCLHDGVSLEKKNPYLEVTAPDMKIGQRAIDQLKSRPPGRVFFTHLGYEALPESMKKNNTKIIYVHRNPKDAIVSMYHFFRSHVPMQFHGDLQEIINSFTEERVMYGPFFDHIAGYWEQKGVNPNIFFTSFEALKQDFMTEVTKLSQFLGKNLTEEQVQKVMYECAFDQMKNNESVNKAAVGARGYFDFNKSPFIRAGKIGNWQAHFTEAQNKQVDEWVSRHLKRDDLKGLSFVYV